MKNIKIKILLIISICVIIIDQITKFLIDYFVRNSIKIIPRILEIEIVQNTGMAFGINSGNVKNIFITVIVIILVINFIKKQFELIDEKTMLSLSFIVGGGISNLVDRIFRGGVFDYIKISTFPIFNIADIVIVAGWILLIINIVRFSGTENKMKE